ncbi:MAG: hypothetical protein GX998_08445 [Firmicutes bacterium]|nr:hypothetical protein [Bacillota bacterium]
MGKRKSRRDREGSFDHLLQDGLESLEKIRAVISTAESITSSLYLLLGNYQALQADGGLQRLLSIVNDVSDPDEEDDE